MWMKRKIGKVCLGWKKLIFGHSLFEEEFMTSGSHDPSSLDLSLVHSAFSSWFSSWFSPRFSTRFSSRQETKHGCKMKKGFWGRIIFITSTFTCILMSAFPVDDDNYLFLSHLFLSRKSEIRETRHNLCLLLSLLPFIFRIKRQTSITNIPYTITNDHLLYFSLWHILSFSPLNMMSKIKKVQFVCSLVFSRFMSHKIRMKKSVRIWCGVKISVFLS